MTISNKQLGKLRIIAGQWRGRSIEFIDETGTRPTHDRVRETLFNWLQGDIADTNCLDLFAGSGALGFEALSRGARHVTMLESDPTVYQQLCVMKQKLSADQATVLRHPFFDGMAPLAKAPFDLVFLDPPYNQGVLVKAISWLRDNNQLSSDAMIYVEAEAGFDLQSIATDFDIYRHKKNKRLQYALLT